MLPPGMTLLFGIGAQKAGTTWLYDYLAAHPDCHLPGEKEVHYFDVLRLPEEARHLERRLERVRQLAGNVPRQPGPALLQATRRLRRALDLVDIHGGDGRTHERYFDHLLDGATEERVVGDVTPSYAMLDRATFAEMAGLAETTRFVFVMRDPVDRAWSALRQQAEAERPEPDAFRERCVELVDRVVARDSGRIPPRSDYVRTITELEAAVPRDRVLYLFYEDLFRAESVEALCRFLGIPPLRPDFDRVSRAAPVFALDPGRLDALRERLAEQYEFMAARFGADLPAAWRRRMTVRAGAQ